MAVELKFGTNKSKKLVFSKLRNHKKKISFSRAQNYLCKLYVFIESADSKCPETIEIALKTKNCSMFEHNSTWKQREAGQ